MFSLSTRAREAIKTALAMVIAYGVSLGMGWENPYWAGFAVAMISLSTVGQSLNKATMRVLGTLVAATAALTLFALFGQERWWFVGVLSVYLGFCTYMITGKKVTYFWWCAAFVCLVISTHSAGDIPNAFETAVLRLQETGLGILVYTLISVFLWPSDSRGALEDATRNLLATQAKLYRAYVGLASGRGAAEDSRPLRMQEIQLLSQCEHNLRAAATDSYEVFEVRQLWWRFHRDSTALMETLERWRQSFPEIQPLERSALLPNLQAVCSELDLRFEEIGRMLAGEAPARAAQPVTLLVDETAVHALTHFQKAAVALFKVQIDRLEALSRSLFDCVRDIKGHGRQAPITVPEDTRAGGLRLDPDRLQAAVRTVAATWIAFPIWFYFDPPGHAGFVEITLIFVVVSAMMGLNPATLVKAFFISSVLAGVLYVFIMPHLSSYTQLGAMIFCVTFAIYYLFWQPSQGAAKSAAIVQVLNVMSVQNEQTYDFADYANTVLLIALAGALVIAIAYLPPSRRPEKVFLRLLARFFRHSEYLMSQMALDQEQNKGIAGRWKTDSSRADLLELPQKLESWGAQIDHRAFSANSPEQVQALVSGLHALALRINGLAGMRDHRQADLLVRELLDDVRAWRLLVEGQFRLWADNPAMALGPSVELQARLEARLAKLETRVDETFRLTGEGELSAEDYENFYRLLGSLRGLSETAIAYVRLAEKFDWADWREERFS